MKDQSTYLYIYYLSKGLVPCPILSLNIVMMTPVLSKARIWWLACCWPLLSVQFPDAGSGPRFIHRVQTPVGFFHNYFSDQNYSICFTNSIWSVLLSPLIIPPLLRDSAALYTIDCAEMLQIIPDYWVPGTVMFSLADASSGDVNSNHITALNMMFTPKFTHTRILRTLVRQSCSPLRQNYLISITILISFPTVTQSAVE